MKVEHLRIMQFFTGRYPSSLLPLSRKQNAATRSPTLLSAISDRAVITKLAIRPASFVLTLCLVTFDLSTVYAQTMSTDIGTRSALQWVIDTSLDGQATIRTNFGKLEDTPVPADYDGSGRADLAVVREVDDQWEWIVDIDADGVADIRQLFGDSTDLLQPADYNSDGKADFAVLRERDDQWEWIVDTSRDGTANIRVTFGNLTDTVIPADYNGDGATDFAVLRTIDDQLEWIIDTNRDGMADLRQLFGQASDTVRQADYNADGAVDFAVLRTVENQQEWIVDTNHDGGADIRKRFGTASDEARPADYDGDGAADFAVLRRVDGKTEWIVDTDRDGISNLRQIFGESTDDPHPLDYSGDGRVDFAVTRSIEYIQGSSWPQIESVIDSLVMTHLKENTIPGATVAISKDGRLILEKGYGFRNIEQKSPMHEFHMSRIGSVSKMVTVPAALALTEQHDGFSIESPLYGGAGVLNNPAFMNAIEINVANVNNDQPLDWFTNLKVVHLMSHSAGFSNSDEKEAARELDIEVNELKYEQVHEHFLRTKRLRFEPGTDSEYSNHHIGTLGHVIEQVTGETYGQFVADTVLSPINLSHMQLENGEVDARDAFPHKYSPFRIEFGDTSDTPQSGDFDANGMADLAVIRKTDGQWEWIVDTNFDGNPDIRQLFGNSSDLAIPEDYDGDGAVDLAVLRKSDDQLEWIIDTNRDGTVDIRRLFGKTTDIEVPADYDGDGTTDLAVLREVAGQLEWIVDTNRDGVPDIRQLFGNASDTPVPADYNGDGATDFAMARVVAERWEWIIDTNNDGVVDQRQIYGLSTDVPQPADFNGDNADDFTVLRVVQGQWEWIIDTNRDGEADSRRSFGTVSDTTRYAEDYNGNGRVDRTALRDVDGKILWIMDTRSEVDIYDASPNVLGFAAGGWTASARDLVRLMCAIDKLPNQSDILDQGTLDLMETPPFATFSNRTLGWQRRESNGSLWHNGSTVGGYAAIVRNKPGTKLQGVDIGEINVAVAFNIQNGTNWRTLTDELAKLTAQADISSDFDLF